MKLIAKTFNELTTTELYEILKSRAAIFIVEQNITYQDMDDIDYRSFHCFYQENDKIIAYLRAFYENELEGIMRIGRVLTLVHGQGLGKKIFAESLNVIIEKYHPAAITMNAQTHAISFYEQFGFAVTSDEFLEEGVMHVKMTLNIESK